MPPPYADIEEEADRRASTALRQTYARTSGPAYDDRVSFRSWTPNGARTKKKRRFTLLAVDGRPELVCKTALDDDDRKVTGEWDKLVGLKLSDSFGYAHPVARTETGFIMTYAPSADLPDALLAGAGPDTFAGLLGRVVEAASRLHLSGALVGAGPENRYAAARQYVADPLVESAHLRTAVEHALVGPTHGDLAPWNVRYDVVSDWLAIIDWEDYRPHGIAGMDVVNLLVTLGLAVFPEYRERGLDWLYERVLESDHWYAQLVREQIVRYAGLTGQAPRQVIDLLPLHCQWLMTRLRNEGRDPAPLYYDRFLRRYTERVPRWVDDLPSV